MEVSNIIACDRAFGAHLTGCPWQSRHKNTLDFQERPAKEKIFRGDNEDPLSFLKMVAGSVDDKKIKLPLIGYFRDAGFNFDPLTTTEKILKDVLPLEGSDKEYPIELSFFQLNYQILVAATTKMETAEVGIPLHRYLNFNRYFPVRYKFFHQDPDSGDGFVHSFKCRILDPRMVSYSDVKVRIPDSLPQFFALQASYEVRAPVVFMDKAEPVEEEIELIDIQFV